MLLFYPTICYCCLNLLIAIITVHLMITSHIQRKKYFSCKSRSLVFPGKVQCYRLISILKFFLNLQSPFFCILKIFQIIGLQLLKNIVIERSNQDTIPPPLPPQKVRINEYCNCRYIHNGYHFANFMLQLVLFAKIKEF